jgi:hypothetical protein
VIHPRFEKWVCPDRAAGVAEGEDHINLKSAC